MNRIAKPPIEQPLGIPALELHGAGVDVPACGTCVERFGLRDRIAVGAVSNMDAIIATLDTAEKVITL